MSTKQPNILLIFTDMQRADTIHALGNPTIKTPNLDRLVREGTSFTSCYSPSPVCVPARCSMHYGLYPPKTGLAKNGVMMNDNNNSFPAVLGRAGYTTKGIGKCHFTPERNALRGFQSRLTQEECTNDPAIDDYIAYLKEHNYDDFEAHGARGEMYYIPQVSSLPAEAHPTQWIGDRSIDFLKEHADTDTPWCLFSSIIHPHPPFAPPKPWHRLYRSPNMPFPQTMEGQTAEYTWINRYQNRYKYRDQGIDKRLMQNIKAYYYATISFIDYQVGRMMEALDETGQLDNTLIIFTSDHGEYLGDFDCFGKRSMHDASSRVPMIVRYPERFEAGQACNTPVSLVDVFPTMAAASGVSLDDIEVDGVDMADIASGKSERQYVYSQFDSKERAIYMIVSREWKYFYSVADRKEYLFSRQTELPDSCDKADNPAYCEIKATLKQALLEFLQSQSADDAYVETGGELDWREYPKIDETFLDDPDARLLYQDYGSYELDVPGYTD